MHTCPTTSTTTHTNPCVCASLFLPFFYHTHANTKKNTHSNKKTTPSPSPPVTVFNQNYFFNALCTPDKISGSSNEKPAAVNFLGTARCPPNSISSPISPKRSWAAGAGKGKICVLVQWEKVKENDESHEHQRSNPPSLPPFHLRTVGRNRALPIAAVNSAFVAGSATTFTGPDNFGDSNKN